MILNYECLSLCNFILIYECLSFAQAPDFDSAGNRLHCHVNPQDDRFDPVSLIIITLNKHEINHWHKNSLLQYWSRITPFFVTIVKKVKCPFKIIFLGLNVNHMAATTLQFF